MAAVKEKLQSYKDKVLSTKGVTVKQQFGYAGGIFGNAMGQDSVHTFGDTFSRDFMGISGERVLIKDNISTIVSFLMPPIIGAWYDKEARPGKRSNISRAISLAPIPFAIASLLLFIVPTGSAMNNFIWTIIFTLVFNVADTFFDMAMSAMALKLVQNPSDRANFYTLSSIGSTFGSMLPGWIIPVVMDRMETVRQQQIAYLFVAIFFAVIGTASMYLPFFAISRRNDLILRSTRIKTHEEAPKISWDKDTLKLLLHNRPFVIVQLSLMFDVIRQVTYNTLPYLYRETFDNFGMKAIIDMISGALSYLGLFSVPLISTKVSPKAILMGGYSYTSVFYVIMSLFNIKFSLGKVRKFRWFIGVLLGLAGMPNSAQGIARNIMIADSTDYMEWYALKNNISVTRCDGLLVAAQNILRKVFDLFKTNLYSLLFIAIKYKEKDPGSTVKVVQTDSTLRGIFNIISICGLLGNALAALSLIFYRYTGKQKEEINGELAKLREANAASAPKAESEA